MAEQVVVGKGLVVMVVCVAILAVIVKELVWSWLFGNGAHE